MSDSPDTDFQATYGLFKGYRTPSLDPKQVRRFDAEFWVPMGCAPDSSVLEVGCSTGLFLAYLKEKGVGDFLGIDRDRSLARYVPKSVADHFLAADVWDFLEDNASGRRFDIAVLFDVLEHFTPQDGARLLKGLAGVLKPGGRVLLKLPNMSSPWGAKYQFGDLTHKAAYNPASVRQLALAAGYSDIACYPCPEGSPARRFLDPLFHRILSKILMSPPEIWTANFFAILE